MVTKKTLLIFVLLFSSIHLGIGQFSASNEANSSPLPKEKPYLIVLGTVQDAGSPQIGCTKNCCIDLRNTEDPDRMVVSLGLIDPEEENKYIFEATPDLPRQLTLLSNLSGISEADEPNGIFLTHAHIGHYAGLMYLGKEAIDSRQVPVFAMPRMKTFLETNGPWDQLIKRSNIQILPIHENDPVQLNQRISVTPFLVPHRDEYSETVGYLIEGPEKKALFIPDIDKWSKWEEDIVSWIKKVDYAFLDATFFDVNELPGRNMDETPHPFVEESMQLFKNLTELERSRVFFIHFNHTNPLLNKSSSQSKIVRENGFNIASVGQAFNL